MRVRERAQAKKLVDRFESASIQRGSAPTAEANKETDQEYFEAKFELLTYIYKLGVSRGNTSQR